MSILRRLANSRFSKVVRGWQGETVALFGGGPSLTQEQVAQVRKARLPCIAVNDSFLWVPFADVLYFADWAWHDWNSKGMPKPLLGLTAAHVRERFARFKGLRCSIENGSGSVPDDVHLLRNRDYPICGFGLSANPEVLVTGKNSGFQALNIAILAGAKVVLLLGFDGTYGADGRTHFFGEHPRLTPPEVFRDFRESFDLARSAIADAKVRVVNCSPGSVIDAFEHVELEKALRL